MSREKYRAVKGGGGSKEADKRKDESGKRIGRGNVTE